MTAKSVLTTNNVDRAIDALDELYETARRDIANALKRYLTTGKPPSASTRRNFCYPYLRVHWDQEKKPEPTNYRAFGKLQAPGTYETTITHPSDFRSYLQEQLEPLVTEYGATLEIGRSQQEIPYPYVTEHFAEISADGTTAADLARYFPTPQLAAIGDEIADSEFIIGEGQLRPLTLFDATRVDYSLRRLIHYTGSHWSHTQHWIILTNYHRYVDQFVGWARGQLADPARPYTNLIMPGDLVIDADMAQDATVAAIAACAWHRYQMPAYHLAAPDGAGVTLVNIGVGPSNAKTITDHLAVLRPNCWLMVGHCGGLRQTQQIGDYVLAHAYLRQDRILDALVPPEVPIPALAEVQIALQDAAIAVTGEPPDALKQRLRTGTVVTYDDRNWELRFSQERKRINRSRAIAVDMESGTIATQGFRLRVPYGTLLCVSDKPLHGEIKLPGTANEFYERAVGQHLEIGLKTLDLLRARRETLHSRKLRAFDEPPFR